MMKVSIIIITIIIIIIIIIICLFSGIILFLVDIVCIAGYSLQPWLSYIVFFFLSLAIIIINYYYYYCYIVSFSFCAFLCRPRPNHGPKALSPVLSQVIDRALLRMCDVPSKTIFWISSMQILPGIFDT